MKRNYYIAGLIMLTFFVISFLTNVIGPLIPDMITGFNLSLTLVAVLPFAFFIAYGVMSIPSGMLIEKYKEKKIMIAAFVVAFAGALLLALFPNYLSAVVSLFLIGCGMAMLQVTTHIGWRRKLCFYFSTGAINLRASFVYKPASLFLSGSKTQNRKRTRWRCYCCAAQPCASFASVDFFILGICNYLFAYGCCNCRIQIPQSDIE